MKKLFYTFIAALVMISGCSNGGVTNLKGRTFVLDGQDISITFDAAENKFYGKAVNNYFGVQSIDKHNIKMELQGSTMMMGPSDKMVAETKYFNDLNGVTSYTVHGNVLTLKGDGIEIRYLENK